MTALKQFVDVLEKTQWMGPDELAAYQRKTLAKVLRHAYETVPFYRDRLAALFGKNGSIRWDRWDEVPFLTKSDIQDHSDDLTSRTIPEKHGEVFSENSSGSTGHPTEVKHTMLSRYAKAAIAERMNAWHGIQHYLKLATLRPKHPGVADYPEGKRESNWAAYADYLKSSGPHTLLNMTTPLDQQIEWLAREKPDYIATFPSNANALADYVCHNPAIRSEFRLKNILTTGEILSLAARDNCRNAFGIEIIDNYSAIECGALAIQCPDSEHYHVQSEVVLLELLNEEGRPCKGGELGQVVVTPFYNFAMPLIRYRMNDHALAGAPCSCGRTLPVLQRILGRSRNLFRFPDGTTVQPDLKTLSLVTHLRPRQWQVAQTDPLGIEIRLVPSDPGHKMDFDAMTAHIRKMIRPDLTVKYVLLDEIPLKPGGKHEDYVCELP